MLRAGVDHHQRLELCHAGSGHVLWHRLDDGGGRGVHGVLWFPFSPEKVATFAIAMALLRWLFPKDEKTLKVMKELYASAKAKASALREKHKAKKESPDRN